MRLSRIFTQQPLDTDSIDLEPEPSRHLARALRLREGDSLILFNGQGGEYAATILSIDKKSVRVSIDAHQETQTESHLSINLGVALSRGERFDWVIQKATELGVHAIYPLFTEHTGVKLSEERTQKKQRHWQQIAISACEQCGRNQIPAIALPQPVNGWLKSTSSDLKLVMHTAVETALPNPKTPDSIDLLVGPEGGFSENEVAAAVAHGFHALQLGPRVLRTETAPVAALAVLQAQWGDLRAF